MNLCGKKIFNNELNQYGLTRPVKKPFPDHEPTQKKQLKK
jgi:tetraacyldisaccharide-1-P 4'-kinase